MKLSKLFMLLFVFITYSNQISFAQEYPYILTPTLTPTITPTPTMTPTPTSATASILNGTNIDNENLTNSMQNDLIAPIKIKELQNTQSIKIQQPDQIQREVETFQVSCPSSYLVGHWTFDETNGSALDSSGNGHNGTTYNIVPGKSGKFGNAFEFNGSDSYVSAVDHEDWNIGSGDYSISMWVKPYSIPTGGETYVLSQITDGNSPYTILALYNSYSRFYSYNGSGMAVPGSPYGPVLSSSIDLENDGWYHIVVSVSSTTSKLYIDKTERNSKTRSGSFYNISSPLFIGGQYNYTAATSLNGLIDDVRIYKGIAVDQSQVNALYDGCGTTGNTPTPTPPPGSTNTPTNTPTPGTANAFWELNGNINDSSGNGHNGIVYGAAPNQPAKIPEFGTSYLFDGVNDYITTANLLQRWNPGSISFWYKTNSSTHGGVMLSKITNSSETGWFIRLDYSQKLFFGFAVFGNYHYWYSNNTFGDTTNWHHIAIVYDDGDGQSLKAYHDGVLQTGNWNVGNGNIDMDSTHNNPVHMGHLFSGNNYYNGYLDHVRMYDTALTASDVAFLYNEGNGGGPINTPTPTPTSTSTPVPIDPDALPQFVIANMNVTTNITLDTNTSLIPDQNENYSILINPEHGNLTLLTEFGGVKTRFANYTPDSGFTGHDRFMFKYTNANGSDTAFVDIFVEAEEPELAFYPYGKTQDSDVKNNPNDRWFPIGWAVNVPIIDASYRDNQNFQIFGDHDNNITTQKIWYFPDWEHGHLEYLVDDGSGGSPWVNTVIARSFPNFEGWGWGRARQPAWWTTTDYYIQFLNKLTEIKNNHGDINNFNFKAIPFLISKIWDHTNIQNPPFNFTDSEGITNPFLDIKTQYRTSGTWKSSLDNVVNPIPQIYDSNNNPINIQIPIPALPNFGGTYNQTNVGEKEIFAHRIKQMYNHPQIAGWYLVDELMGADQARRAAIDLNMPTQYDRRIQIQDQVLEFKDILELNDTNNLHIMPVIRGTGNLPYKDDLSGLNLSAFDQVDNLGSIWWDDLYLEDYANLHPDNGEHTDWLGFAVKRTQVAIDMLDGTLDRMGGTNAPNTYSAYTLWSQGFKSGSNPDLPVGSTDGNGNSLTQDGYLSLEQLRYVIYGPWINGAQGALFWNLSESNDIAYNIAKQMSYESHLVSKYLLQKPSEMQYPVSNISVTSTGGDDTIQYIVREDLDFIPNVNYKNRIMIMFCNNLDQAATISIHFSEKVLPNGQIDPNYSTDVMNLIGGSDMIGNVFEIEMAAYTARAYIFNVKH